MANINAYADEYSEDGENVLSIESANQYAATVAIEALTEYIKQAGEQTQPVNTTTTGGSSMNQDGITEAAQAVMTETKTNAAIISGEILLDNIETIANKLVLSRMPWWQRLVSSKQNQEIAVTIATYAIIHAMKTGGFGLTKYRINHAALDFVTLAANARMLKYVVKAVGVDTNVAEAFLTLPTVTTV